MTDEPKKYLYEPTEEEIRSRSRAIRKSRNKDLRETTYIPPHETHRRVYRVNMTQGRSRKIT